MIFKKYSIWISADWKKHQIKDMTTMHIINCINMIARSFISYDNTGDRSVFNHVWTLRHGERYMRAFCKELKCRGHISK